MSVLLGKLNFKCIDSQEAMLISVNLAFLQLKTLEFDKSSELIAD